MEKWKDITQYSTAVAAFLSGVTLAFIQYFETGDLTSGVLGYVAQVLVYAAGIFGVTMYWNGKYRETMNVIDARYSRIEKELNDRNNTNVVSGPSK
jgi:Na+/melibiose symporter-like transporter